MVYGDHSLRVERTYDMANIGTVFCTGLRRQYQKVKMLKHLTGKFREIVLLKKSDGTVVRI